MAGDGDGDGADLMSLENASARRLNLPTNQPPSNDATTQLDGSDVGVGRRRSRRRSGASLILIRPPDTVSSMGALYMAYHRV